MNKENLFDTEDLNELHSHIKKMIAISKSQYRPPFFDLEEKCISDTECLDRLYEYLRIHKRIRKERRAEIDNTQAEQAEIENSRKETGAIINTFYKSGKMEYDIVIRDLQKSGALMMNDSHDVDHAILLRDMESEEIINLLRHYSSKSLGVYLRKHEKLKRHMCGFIATHKSIEKLERKISLLEN